jgi:hypothetical protein
MAKVFISYSVKDEESANKLYESMTHLGIDAFMAGISIEPGQQWSDEIFKHLREAKWVFFLASKKSCESQSVQQELGGALIQEKTIIPILLDIKPEELPGWIDRHQAIDIKQDPQGLHKTIQNVADKLKMDTFWAGVMIGVLLLGAFYLLKES